MLGKSPMKWRQRPDMTIAVDCDVKHQFKQTNEQNIRKISIPQFNCIWGDKGIYI